MDLLNNYFSTLTFKRLEEKQGYAIYGAAIKSLLGGDKQQTVLAFVPQHLAISNVSKLSELPWKNLQMRMCLKNAYKLKPQTWSFPYSLKNLNLILQDRTKTYSTYACIDEYFPFEILLIHSSKKKTIYQYPNSTNLHWAIDQFSTVFNYNGEQSPMQHTTIETTTAAPVSQISDDGLYNWVSSYTNPPSFKPNYILLD